MNVWLLARLAALGAAAATHQLEPGRGAPAAAGPSVSAPSGCAPSASAPSASAPPMPSAAAATADAPLFAQPAPHVFDDSVPESRRRLLEPLHATRDEAKRVLARYFPLIYRDLPVRHTLLFQGTIDDTSSYRSGEGEHFIEWPLRQHEAADARVATPFEGPKLQRRIVDLLVYLHEYAHVLFNESVGTPKSQAKGWTARSALTEGFALTLELSAVDRMLQEPDYWGLARADIADLRSWRKQRLSTLRSERNHYSDGAFGFMGPVFKRDGEAGLRRLLERLNVDTLEAIPYDLSLFRLIARKPEVFEPVLSKPISEQPALAGLQAIMQGQPASIQQRMEALALVDAADPRALAHMLGRFLSAPSDLLSDHARRPERIIGPAFRLAASSPRAGRTLAKMSISAARSPHVHRMLRVHPRWAEALISGVTMLPLSIPAKAAWRATVERWLETPPDLDPDDARVRALAPNWIAHLRP